MFLEDSSGSSFIWILLIAIIGLLIGNAISSNKIDKSKIIGLSVNDFLNTMRKGTLIDIRSEKLFNESKILGAKNFPNKSGAKTSSIRRDIPIFIYDEKGKRAKSVAASYVKNNAVVVYYMIGGYEEYLKRNENK